MSDDLYAFRIDVFTPETLPMARLAQYMAGLAELVGFKDTTHFVRVDAGSARLISRVEAQDVLRVRQRLSAVGGPAADPGVAKAFKVLDDMLAEDDAVGEILGPEDALIIQFPGRTRPKPLAFPAFGQDGSLDGQIVRIGGKDRTAHVTLRDGSIVYSNIELSHAQARDMARHLYGSKVRLFGRGRWERHPDGTWKLLTFTVDRHEVLDDAPLSELLAEIRQVPDNRLIGDRAIYDELLALRLGEDEVH